MIPVGASGPSAELPFSLFNATTGNAITGHSFQTGDVKVRVPGGTWANADTSNIVEWGNGQYGLRLTAAQTASAGPVGVRADTGTSIVDRQFDYIGTIQRGASGSAAEIPFSIYNAIAGTETTGQLFASGYVKVRLPGGGWEEANTANIVEWGLGQYGLQLTAMETRDPGPVGVRVLTGSSALDVRYLTISTTLYTASSGTTTTPEAIRDRAITVIEALTPAADTSIKFRAFRNEHGADFQAWAEANPTSAQRRFQVRTTGGSVVPEVSNTSIEEHQVTLRVLVSYPHSHRWGRGAGLDRDDVMDQDTFQIDEAIGMLGKANFSSPYANATWIEGAPREVIRGASCDFVELELVYIYQRTR